MPRRMVVAGTKYGQLTAVRFLTQCNSNDYWLFQCDCGREKIALTEHGRPRATSCGCIGRNKTLKRNTTHGMSGLSEYNIWKSMRKRCNSRKAVNYQRYGGVGITICERWANSFENFLADMGRRPSPKHSLDRFPDRKGNYEPTNCRWATIKQQNNNTNRNFYVTVDGRTMSLMEATELRNVNYSKVYSRLKKGWTIERALAP